MTPPPTLTLRRTKTTLTLTDGQTAWTLDRANALRLAAQIVDQAGKMEDGAPTEPRRVSGFAVSRKGAL